MTALSAGGRVKGAGLGPHLARGAAHAVGALAAELRQDGAPPGPSRGLASVTIADRIAELEAGANTSRTGRPLYHVHCDPRQNDEALVSLFWTLFEREFGLTRARFASQRHSKGDRGDHTHRVYDITRPDGSVVDMRHDYYRREKVMVVACYTLGRPMPPVPHLRAIAKALRAEGRADVVAWMEAQPPAPRAIAQRTPEERQAEQRTGALKAPAAEAVLRAWTVSDSGPALLAALHAEGLDLAQGDSAVMVVDGRGGAWPLPRMVGGATRERGQRVKAAAVHARVKGLRLPTVEGARDAIRARGRAAREAEEARRLRAQAAARERVRRRAEMEAVPRRLEARAVEIRATLAGIDAEKAEAPSDVVAAEAKVTASRQAEREAKAALERAEASLVGLGARRPVGWLDRIKAWSDGTTADLDRAVRAARERRAQAGQWVSTRAYLAAGAEARRDRERKAWASAVAADKVARAGPLRDELSFAVRALDLLRRDPEAALLPPAAFRQAVEDDPGPEGPAPRPRWG